MKVITIGRSNENDIIISDPSVSRNHCQIIQDANGQFKLADFGSANGTFVNGQKIKGEFPLQDNDLVKIGNMVLPWKTYFSGNLPPKPPVVPNGATTTSGTTGGTQGRKSGIKKHMPSIIGGGIVLIVAIAVVAFLCFRQHVKTANAQYIPEDAFAVASVDFMELPKNRERFDDSFFEDKDIKEWMRELEKESYHAAELIRKAVKDPAALGIRFDKKMYGFVQMTGGNNVTGGFIFAIAAKTFEKNLENIIKDCNLEEFRLTEREGIKFYEIENGTVFGWKNDVFIMLLNSEGKISFSDLQRCFGLEGRNLPSRNADFKQFSKSGHFLDVWISSNFIKEIRDKDLQDYLKKMENYSGIDINDNYAYFHYDVKEDQMTVSATIKYNETIQKLDVKKIQRNKEEIIRLIEEILGYNQSYDPWNDPRITLE